MMKNIKYIIFIAIGFLGLAFVYKLKNQPAAPTEQPIVQVDPKPSPQPEPAPEPKPEPPKAIEPKFDNWPKVRTVTNEKLGKILQDIDSHMPAGHQYSDANKVTWAHETTHGINSNIRNKHPDSTKVNGFYCLNDRACVIYEPKTTIRAFASTVPQALRGPSYNLYLVQQTSGWNDRPLYIFDEWIAYTNGSETGRELNHQGWYYELLQAHNFNVYSMYLAKHIKEKCPDYDTQLKAFMMWNIERTFRLAAPFEKRDVMQSEPEEVGQSGKKHLHPHVIPTGNDDQNPTKEALDYVEKVRTLPEAEPIRTFARQYFGAEWCKRIYGF
jgi:hypothetical protein